MPVPSLTTVGVVVAGGVVHVCLRRPRSTAYTTEPITPATPQARQQALITACRRLGVQRARAAAALPENRVIRRELHVPRGLRRRERTAVLRLRIRDRLPPPTTTWRYRLQRQSHSHWRLTAARQTDLRAARQLLRGAGLRPVAILPTADALPRLPASPTSRSAGLPRPPGERLTAALAEAARRPGPTNLLGAHNPSAKDHAPSARLLAGTTAATALAGIAAHLHLDAPGLDAHGDAETSQAPPASATMHQPTEPPSSHQDGLPPEASDQQGAPDEEMATPEEQAGLPSSLQASDARRRQMITWLDALATQRPNQMRLTAVEIAESLTISAQASERAAIEAYLEGLREEGLQPRLEHLENTDKEGLRLRLHVPLASPEEHTDEQPTPPPEAPVREQLQRLAESAEDHELSVTRLEQHPPDERDITLVALRLEGPYPALRQWLSVPAQAETRIGVRRLQLQADEERQVEANLTLELHPATGTGQG